MKNWLYILTALLLLGTQACQNSKHFTKLGQKQEAAGLNKEASESYYTALWKKRANIDAQIGMKKTVNSAKKVVLATKKRLYTPSFRQEIIEQKLLVLELNFKSPIFTMAILKK